MVRLLGNPRLLHFTWLLFFIALPFSKALSTVSEVALLVLAIPAALAGNFRADLYRYRHVTALCLVPVILLLGLTYTENLHSGFKIITRYHRFLIIPLFFIAHRQWLLPRVKTYLQVFVAAVAAVCLITLLFYALPPALAATITEKLGFVLPYPKNHDAAAFGLYTPFTDRLQLGSLISIALLSAIYLFSIAYKKLLNLVLFSLLFITLFMLGARGALLALLVALPFYFFLLAQRSIRPVLAKRTGNTLATLLILVCLVAGFIGLPWAAYKTLKPVQSRVDQTRWEIEMYQNGQFTQYSYQHFTTLRRVASWQNLWQVVKQHPVMGVGTGDYTDALTQAYADDRYKMQLHNHNQYLMFWAMTGIWGLGIFLGILVFWLWRMRFSGFTFYFAAAFMLFYVLNMMPDAVLHTQADSTAFCSFISLIGLIFRPNRSEHA